MTWEKEHTMRIIAGSLKGRKIQAPDNDEVRPTSDRTRESVFNLLMHGQFGGDNIIGERVADLCCGTGAIGLEAISRGATTCQFVDISKKSLELAKSNAIHCGVSSQCQFLPADIIKLPPVTQPFALVFMDPPYAKNILSESYASLTLGNWFKPGSLLVAELPRRIDLPVLEGAELVTSRDYGKHTSIQVWRIL